MDIIANRVWLICIDRVCNKRCEDQNEIRFKTEIGQSLFSFYFISKFVTILSKIFLHCSFSAVIMGLSDTSSSFQSLSTF